MAPQSTSVLGHEQETFRFPLHSVTVMLYAEALYFIADHSKCCYCTVVWCRHVQWHHLTCRPKISRDAHARPGRTVQELSSGDALRHELLVVRCKLAVRHQISDCMHHETQHVWWNKARDVHGET